MENKKYRLLKKSFDVFVLIIVGFCLSNYIIDVTYAYEKSQEPDVIITIDADGNITQNGSLFGEELWYPGKVEDGIIEIINNNKLNSIYIANLGIDVEINTTNNGYDRDEIYNSFVDNMKLTVQKRMAVFSRIIDNKSFNELLYKQDDDIYNGFPLDGSGEIRISMGEPVYLKYRLYMHENSGNELEQLNANVDFYINFEEK